MVGSPGTVGSYLPPLADDALDARLSAMGAV